MLLQILACAVIVFEIIYVIWRYLVGNIEGCMIGLLVGLVTAAGLWWMLPDTIIWVALRLLITGSIARLWNDLRFKRPDRLKTNYRLEVEATALANRLSGHTILNLLGYAVAHTPDAEPPYPTLFLARRTVDDLEKLSQFHDVMAAWSLEIFHLDAINNDAKPRRAAAFQGWEMNTARLCIILRLSIGGRLFALPLVMITKPSASVEFFPNVTNWWTRWMWMASQTGFISIYGVKPNFTPHFDAWQNWESWLGFYQKNIRPKCDFRISAPPLPLDSLKSLFGEQTYRKVAEGIGLKPYYAPPNDHIVMDVQLGPGVLNKMVAKAAEKSVKKQK